MLKKLYVLLCLIANFCYADPKYDVTIVSMFRNEAPYLKEWVEYHLLAGISHFWLFDNSSSDNFQEILQPYIDRGIVELISWPSGDLKEHWVPYQLEAFKEGLRRSKGIAKWVALIDIDEFILPMQGGSIFDCLEINYPDAKAVYANWRNFGTSGLHIPAGTSLVLNLTGCSLPTHPTNGNGKSILKPEYVDVDHIWHTHHCPLVSDYTYVNGDNEIMPFSRGNDLCTDGKNHGDHIRINHYMMRDEDFYYNCRLPKVIEGFGVLAVLEEHYISFSLGRDDTIIDYVLDRTSGNPYWACQWFDHCRKK